MKTCDVLGPSYSYREVDFNHLLPRCTWGSCKLLIFVHELQIFVIFWALSEGTDSQVTVQLQTVLWNALCRYSCCSNSRRRRRWNEWAELFPKVKSTRTGAYSCCLSQARVERKRNVVLKVLSVHFNGTCDPTVSQGRVALLFFAKLFGVNWGLQLFLLIKFPTTA